MIRCIAVLGVAIFIAGCSNHGTMAQPLTQQIASCAGKLPANQTYTLDYSTTIDTQETPAKIGGTFNVSWESKIMTEAEQRQSFEALSPFIECVSPAISNDNTPPRVPLKTENGQVGKNH
ncbi:hypothetical protein GZ77_10635 [Endozoicomonas montiporae]|uniref:Lipoprotein n=2 Tax=Endozoicomonas montiporae TaxID=1027273 RepID=A0A081N8H3_9GAMM|nr:hypothetical protein [Endozoicomonas montiporae]AMO55357.1 hypothetical protein EZMO1_1161 [Endozoicomonas montiporae CL-33]KEQ14746.1 hypothetical protein GZ77_10635 [Endozoicomonas montiporae]